MATFQAKTKEDLYPVEPMQPGDSVPQADQNGLRELGATEFFPRIWQYRHDTHTLADFMRPGYFHDLARDLLNVGDEIHFCLEGGHKLPSKWERGVCVVEERPNDRQLPVILAGYVRHAQPVPWDGKTKD